MQPIKAASVAASLVLLLAMVAGWSESRAEPACASRPGMGPSGAGDAPASAGIAPNLILHVVTETEDRRDPATTARPADIAPWVDDAMHFVRWGAGLIRSGPVEYCADPQRVYQSVIASAEQLASQCVPARPIVIDMEGAGGLGPSIKPGWEIQRLPEAYQPIARGIELAFIDAVRARTGGSHVGFFHDLKAPYRRGEAFTADAMAFNTAQVPVFAQGRLATFIAWPPEPITDASLPRIRRWWLAGAREAARVLGTCDPGAATYGARDDYSGTICLELTPLQRKTRAGDELPAELDERAVMTMLEVANTVALENPRLRVIVYLWIQWHLPDRTDPDAPRIAYDGWDWMRRVGIPAARRFFQSGR